MTAHTSPADRARAFCHRHGLRHPILLAPMAGACPPALSIAVAEAGGLGACGALLMTPPDIVNWAATVRAGTDRPFQINLWVPDPAPVRDAAQELALCEALAAWGPAVTPAAGDARPPDFSAQCEALLAARNLWALPGPLAMSLLALPYLKIVGGLLLLWIPHSFG